MTNLERFGNNLFHFFIVFAIIFLFVAAANLGLETMMHAKHRINCPEYPPVDGAGRPDVCK